MGSTPIASTILRSLRELPPTLFELRRTSRLASLSAIALATAGPSFQMKMRSMPFGLFFIVLTKKKAHQSVVGPTLRQGYVWQARLRYPSMHPTLRPVLRSTKSAYQIFIFRSNPSSSLRFAALPSGRTEEEKPVFYLEVSNLFIQIMQKLIHHFVCI